LTQNGQPKENCDTFVKAEGKKQIQLKSQLKNSTYIDDLFKLLTI